MFNFSAFNCDYVFSLAGINSIRLSKINRQVLTSPRIIGNAIDDIARIHSSKSHNSCKFSSKEVPNVLILMMGQFIAHDCGSRQHVEVKGRHKFTNKWHCHSINSEVKRKQNFFYRKGNNANGMRCCSKCYQTALDPAQINPNCIPVTVPTDDPFYRQSNIGCLNFIRSQCTFANNCKLRPCQKVFRLPLMSLVPEF